MKRLLKDFTPSEIRLMALIVFMVLVAAFMMLTGCAAVKPALGTPHAIVEYSEVGAEAAYQSAVAAIDTAVLVKVITPATHDQLWNRYWSDLQQFRLAYNAGQNLSAAWVVLQADKATALGMHP